MIGSAEYPFSDVRIDDGDVMSSFLGQYYGLDHERQVPAEVLTVASAAEDEEALEALLGERSGRKVDVRVPQRGAGRELVAMATKNAEIALTQRIQHRESLDSALEELQDKLHLGDLPQRIECYDVSHLQGTLAVASRVVFDSGLPDKSGLSAIPHPRGPGRGRPSPACAKSWRVASQRSTASPFRTC